jgi:heme/copper-type cytochrome/quinol oxidase subunit 2
MTSITDYNKENIFIYNKKLIPKYSNSCQEIKNFSHFTTLTILLGISFALISISSSSNIGILFQVFAQPAQDYPIPDASRMFTNDTAIIKKFDLNPYVLDLAIVPKNPVAGKPVLFVLNFFDKATKTWLWHSDLRIAISDPEGKAIAVFPNNHGHGSVIEFEYVFPKSGTYNINLLLGQQTGSPNFMIEPKVIRQMDFNITASANNDTQVKVGVNNNTINGKVKDITIKAESWKFTPNVIEVNKGDLVRLHFVIAQDEVALYNGHGFGIEGYNVNAFLLKGTQQTVEFIADKPGTFTFRCTSFCSAPEAAIENHFNMVGKLVVH